MSSGPSTSRCRLAVKKGEVAPPSRGLEGGATGKAARWKTGLPALPLDPSLEEILRIAFNHPSESIERAGLKVRVEDAKARAAKILDKAAVTLAPIGITRTELRDLLVSKLKA